MWPRSNGWEWLSTADSATGMLAALSPSCKSASSLRRCSQQAFGKSDSVPAVAGATVGVPKDVPPSKRNRSFRFSDSRLVILINRAFWASIRSVILLSSSVIYSFFLWRDFFAATRFRASFFCRLSSSLATPVGFSYGESLRQKRLVRGSFLESAEK